MIIALIVFVWVLDAVSFRLYPNPSFVILSSAPVGSRCRQVQVVGGPHKVPHRDFCPALSDLIVMTPWSGVRPTILNSEDY